MEELYFDLKKGEYIKIIDDEIELKRTFLDAHGVCHKSEIVRDKIENFTLMYFKISLKVDIIMNLVNEQKNYFDHIVSTVGKENAKRFEIFRDIMEQHGRFENRSKHDVYYGDYTLENIRKKMREEKFLEDQRERELSNEIRLIECPCCKAQISNQAPVCPKCGQPMKAERPQRIYRINPSGNKEWVHCPKCGSENCSHHQEQHYIPGETEVEYTKNLNPLKPFTVANRKEKVIREEKIVTRNRFICNDCGNIFD